MKAVRKIHVEFCSKVREVIWSGPVPLRGDSEEKRDYMDGDPHWRVSGLSYILGTLALRSDREDKSPDWLEACVTNRRTVER